MDEVLAEYIKCKNVSSVENINESLAISISCGTSIRQELKNANIEWRYLFLYCIIAH